MRRLVQSKIAPGAAVVGTSLFDDIEAEKQGDEGAEPAPGALRKDDVLASFRAIYGSPMTADSLPPWLRGHHDSKKDAAPAEDDVDLEPATA